MKNYMRWCAALALMAGLAGCAGGVARTESSGSGSGVTVFGDVDVGVGRVR